MRILALTDSLVPWHSFRIRFGQYIPELPWKVIVSDNIYEIEKLEKGDVLFFYRFLPSWGCIENNLLRLKRRGVVIVTDIDDCVWQAPLGWDKNRQILYTRAVRMANLITYSTSEIGCLVKQMFRGQKTELIRNSAPLISNARSKSMSEGEMIRVCWTGCPWTRPEDLSLLKPLVKWIRAQKLSVIWRHIGHAEGRLSFADAVGLDPKEVETIRVGDHRHYVKALRGDIGLAPVAKKCFNTYKSEIKLLEYGSRSMTWIASETPAYRDLCERWGLPGRLCETGDDWINHFEMLLDRKIREREKKIWHSLTNQKQNFHQTAKQWVKVLVRLQAEALKQ